MSNMRVRRCETRIFGLPTERTNAEQKKKSTCKTKKLIRTIDRSNNQIKCHKIYFGSYTETYDQTLKTIKFKRYYVVKVGY